MLASKKFLYALFGLFCLAVLGSVLGLGFPKGVNKAPSQFPSLTKREIVIRDEKMTLYIADTDTERQQGLSGSTRLQDDEGMLFVFPEKDLHSFWMKDMKYPLDMIFLNDNRIVDTFNNLSPETYPKLFAPKEPANYVIEFNDSAIERLGLKTGDTILLK